MSKSLLTIIFIFIFTTCFSQQLTLQQKLRSDLNLQSQFQVLLLQSKSFDADFKLIRKSNIEIIQNNVNDSISKYTKEIAALSKNSGSSINTINSLRDSLLNTQAALDLEQSKTDSISFLGIDFKKETYHIIVWSLIIVFLLSFVVVLISFKKAKVDAVEHQKTAEIVQEELQSFKKKAMETEQKLKRQLLDEQLKANS